MSCKVELPQLNKCLSIDKEENLFTALRAAQVPVASSCKGDGVCGKCVVTVEHGDENLTPPTGLEETLCKKYNYSPSQRISCQCQVLGPLVLRTTYW